MCPATADGAGGGTRQADEGSSGETGRMLGEEGEGIKSGFGDSAWLCCRVFLGFLFEEDEGQGDVSEASRGGQLSDDTVELSNELCCEGKGGEGSLLMTGGTEEEGAVVGVSLLSRTRDRGWQPAVAGDFANAHDHSSAMQPESTTPGVLSDRTCRKSCVVSRLCGMMVRGKQRRLHEIAAATTGDRKLGRWTLLCKKPLALSIKLHCSGLSTAHRFRLPALTILGKSAPLGARPISVSAISSGSGISTRSLSSPAGAATAPSSHTNIPEDMEKA